MESTQEFTPLPYDIAQDLLKAHYSLLAIIEEAQHPHPNMAIIKAEAITAMKKLPINNYSDIVKYS